MPTIFIENRPYEVPEGRNLLEACLALGFDIPFFCWHPALDSVGACRLCAVKSYRDEQDMRGRIVMSCMTPAEDGTRISIRDPEVLRFRKAVLEWLMLNHPHDCPVCDEGGECHLQDMTVKTGQTRRRSRHKKRTHRNQYLGPLLHHEMNRCIQCFRCVRFYRNVAGGRDLNVFGSHERLYFGRFDDGILESPFAGNLIEVCPTGVFTDRRLRDKYVRKWDLAGAPAVCPHCSLGCNVITTERSGVVRRILNRYNPEVNGWFLCDRGRFGFERPAALASGPLIREEGGESEREVSKDEAISEITSRLRFGSKAIGIGSPRASLEANQALRSLVGADNFFSGFSTGQEGAIRTAAAALRALGAATVKDVSGADAVLVLGEDVARTAPRLLPALKLAVRNRPIKDRVIPSGQIPLWHAEAVNRHIGEERGPLFSFLCSTESPLDALSTLSLRGLPEDIARLGFEVAHELDAEAPEVPGGGGGTLSEHAGEVARALNEAERPLVLAGTTLGSSEVVEAAAQVVTALRKIGSSEARLLMVFEEQNTMGLALFGAPGLKRAAERLMVDNPDVVFILENDLERRMPGEEFHSFFENARGKVVAIDSTETETTRRARVFLPSADFTACDGTQVNGSGRAQRSYGVIPPGDSRPPAAWRWLTDISSALGLKGTGERICPEQILSELSEELAVFSPLSELIEPEENGGLEGWKVASRSPRSSGRTAVDAHKNIHEQKPPGDPCSPLAFSMEGLESGARGHWPRYRIAGWNSVQAAMIKQSEKTSGPGGRLLSGAGAGPADMAYFSPGDIPKKEKSGEGILVVNAPEIFGSEELSALSPVIRELSPRPWLALSQKEAERLGLLNGQQVVIAFSGGVASRPLDLRVTEALPEGVALLPAGLRGIPPAAAGQRGEVRQA